LDLPSRAPDFVVGFERSASHPTEKILILAVDTMSLKACNSTNWLLGFRIITRTWHGYH